MNAVVYYGPTVLKEDGFSSGAAHIGNVAPGIGFTLVAVCNLMIGLGSVLLPVAASHVHGFCCFSSSLSLSILFVWRPESGAENPGMHPQEA